jgi:hypothetical protein
MQASPGAASAGTGMLTATDGMVSATDDTGCCRSIDIIGVSTIPTFIVFVVVADSLDMFVDIIDDDPLPSLPTEGIIDIDIDGRAPSIAASPIFFFCAFARFFPVLSDIRLTVTN